MTQKIKLWIKPKRVLNQWDVIVLLILLGLLTALVWGAQSMAVPYHLGNRITIHLEPSYLPQYALFTIIRMVVALFLSLMFTFTIGTLAAKNARAEKLILPFIDIMQSVPILGFLSITILAFIYVFPGSRLGPECAAIFAIFTSQVWNMALSFYQSLRSIPKELKDAVAILRLSPWQKFWRLEVPFATPALIWNAMMSLSAGWFFVVASEAILVNRHEITLPGIGSYIHVATEQADFKAIAYALLSMLIVIFLYDQLIFRPLIAWSEKFKTEPPSQMVESPWFLTLLKRARLIHQCLYWIRQCWDHTHTRRYQWLAKLPKIEFKRSSKKRRPWGWWLLYTTLLGSALLVGYRAQATLTWSETFYVFGLGLLTAFKIAIWVFLSSLIWVPIGVYIGLRPRLATWVQPLAQFCAAFPINLVYPLFCMLIMRHHLNVDIWTSPLLILGTQWYILFNVIAGASALPQEYHWVAENYGVKRGLWWRKLIIPGILPYYITGAMTAAGGSWNASIVAEVIEWGHHSLEATGLGSYIAQATTAGDFPRIGLGIAVMSLYVILINRFLWQRLYQQVQRQHG